MRDRPHVGVAMHDSSDVGVSMVEVIVTPPSLTKLELELEFRWSPRVRTCRALLQWVCLLAAVGFSGLLLLRLIELYSSIGHGS